MRLILPDKTRDSLGTDQDRLIRWLCNWCGYLQALMSVGGEKYWRDRLLDLWPSPARHAIIHNRVGGLDRRRSNKDIVSVRRWSVSIVELQYVDRRASATTDRIYCMMS